MMLHSRRFSFVLIVVAFLLVNAALLAQEITPEAPNESPTFTAAFTDTATSPPTPTETFTPLPTPSLTLEVWTATPELSTEIPSATSSAAPQPITATLDTAFTPTLIPPIGLDGGEPEEQAPLPEIQSFGELETTSLMVTGSYAVVGCNDSNGLVDAVNRVNNGEIDTIYLNYALPPDTCSDRTYWLDTRLRFERNATIYGNNAILRLRPGLIQRVLLLWFNVTLNVHHVEITGANLVGWQPPAITDGYGAGIRVNVGSTLNLYDSKVYANYGQEGGGGIMNLGSLNLQRVFINNNYAGGGGGIQNDINGPLTGTCVQFSSNRANYGVALLNGGNGTQPLIQINNSGFSDNLTTGGYEEDIYNLNPFAFILADRNYWSGNTPATRTVNGGLISTQPQLLTDPTSTSACASPAPVLPPAICTGLLSVQGELDSLSTDPCQQNPTPTPTIAPPFDPRLLDYNLYLSYGDTRLAEGEDTIILAAANQVGRAFFQFTSQPNLYSDTFGVSIFRRIMTGDTTFVTADTTDPVIAFIFYARGVVECQTYNVGGNPAYQTTIPLAVRNIIAANVDYSSRSHQAVIACDYAALNTDFPSETIIHELGHVFDGMATNNQLTESVANTNASPIKDRPPMNCAPPFAECPPGTIDSYVVMGIQNIEGYGRTWVRGVRGWGSSPPTSTAALTRFQQHYVGSAPYSHLYSVQLETAADMFLNWTYRMTDPNSDPYPLWFIEAPGTWSGFLNMSWLVRDPRWGDCSAGCTDVSYPGDSRYAWVYDQMRGYFNNHGW